MNPKPSLKERRDKAIVDIEDATAELSAAAHEYNQRRSAAQGKLSSAAAVLAMLVAAVEES